MAPSRAELPNTHLCLHLQAATAAFTHQILIVVVHGVVAADAAVDSRWLVVWRGIERRPCKLRLVLGILNPRVEV